MRRHIMTPNRLILRVAFVPFILQTGCEKKKKKKGGAGGEYQSPNLSTLLPKWTIVPVGKLSVDWVWEHYL